MRIEIVKRTDGGGVLRCTRDDGSVTWQKQGRHALHFALHDMTHYAVETTLGTQRGFFGLIREGWEIEDTTGKGARGPIPPEAGAVEQIVGWFDAERGSGATWTIEEFREFGGETARRLSAETILAIRDRRAELFAKWSDIPPGEALCLSYPPAT